MKNRMFKGESTQRLIVSIEMKTIQKIDRHLRRNSPLIGGNRSEFVRKAIEEKLERINR